jgi:hypothetical protein
MSEAIVHMLPPNPAQLGAVPPDVTATDLWCLTRD